MPWLARLDNKGDVLETWELGQEPLIFGRGAESGIMIGDNEMSRQHFEITYVNNAHFLTDLNSTNGTAVNGQKVPTVCLKSNDRIRAGETNFRYQVGTSTMLGFVDKVCGAGVAIRIVRRLFRLLIYFVCFVYFMVNIHPHASRCH